MHITLPTARRFALVDCNNFYASCERLFDPRLARKPFVILSNNDGCVVSRSPEAKQLGVPMAVPWFQCRELSKRYGIIAFSSNYRLYDDLSKRTVQVLADFSPHIEVYSIDESFLDLTTLPPNEVFRHGQQIKQRMLQWLGLPVCVGIGTTKTLAKLANGLAKKHQHFSGVCDLGRCSEDERNALFARIPVGDVWGIGDKIAARLHSLGIRSALDLQNADPSLMRAHFSVVVERTVRELCGQSCLDLETTTPPRKQILCSRAFGQAIYDLEELAETVALYMSKAAVRLRGQGSIAALVTVFVRTNPFKMGEPQYERALTITLEEPSADTRTLVANALRVLRMLYRPGFAYGKTGVLLGGISPASEKQRSLFSRNDQKSDALMAALDRINERFGRQTIYLLSNGTSARWSMRQNLLSPAYTRNWEELPTAK